MLEVKSLSVRCGALDIVKGVSFAVNNGEWLMIAGPNGAGKSTIINAVTGGVAYTGQILLNGQDIRKKKPVELAKNIGVLTQNHYVGYSFSVEEVVRLGRYAYSPGVLARRCDDDERMVELALEKTGMAAQRRQSVLTLSGGELQRTFLAQVFAQDPKYLLLDEPTSGLDDGNTEIIKNLIREYPADKICILSTHDSRLFDLTHEIIDFNLSVSL